MATESEKELTAEVVEARIAEVAALNRLCASLAEAGSPASAEESPPQNSSRNQ